ncbi:MAG: UDP-N-acetylglucosamine 1-carboxyvinyltransferase [bacterium]|nr:UDP-N-acetylglucosamine 1-carboxyvinyltransferase [bacterium]
MEKFIIKGKKQLKGSVEIGGYKNAAGSVLAATLLTDKECVIDNLPLVEDVLNLIKVLESIGVEVSWLSKRKIKIKAGSNINPEKMDYELVKKMRVSVLLIGPLLARFKHFKIPHPGGDKIGLRPIETHLEAFKLLGANIKNEGDFYKFDSEGLSGKEIILKEFSVTATENILMAASLIPGKTVIKLAAAEPQVQDTGFLLEKMGAKISGVGTHTITIEGVLSLGGASHSIVPDPLEAGTFIIAAAIAGKNVEVKNIIPEHLLIFCEKLRDIGVDLEIKPNGHLYEKSELCNIIVRPKKIFKATKIQALPYPGFPTDLQPMISVLLTQAHGKSLIHDPLFESRLGYAQELRKMGADIEITDPHRAFINGPVKLKGASISSSDIRAGATLVIAALIAEGETEISNIYQLDRGYEKIEEKLQKLGADIKRVKF